MINTISENSKISVIVPIYKVEKYIRKCIDSILNQTYKNLEVILVDDGSPDDCPSICDEYRKKDERVIVIHKTNGGLSDARNAGLNAVSGEYVTFIDGDDYYLPQAIEKMILIAKICNTNSIIKMKFFVVEENKEPHIMGSTEKIHEYSCDEYIKGICEKRLSESVCDKLFPMNLIGNLRFNKERLNEDFLFLSNLLLCGPKIIEIDYYGYCYFQRIGSISRSGYGKSLVDSVRNAEYMREKAIELNLKVEKDFTRLLLFQLRALFITIPKSEYKNKSIDYQYAVNLLRQFKNSIIRCNLTKIDKIMLLVICYEPQIGIKSVQLLWLVKKRLLRNKKQLS